MSRRCQGRISLSEWWKLLRFIGAEGIRGAHEKADLAKLLFELSAQRVEFRYQARCARQRRNESADFVAVD